MTRREFTPAQQTQIRQRAMGANGRIYCEGCGMDITGKAADIDHTTAEGLLLENAKKARRLTIEDGKLLGKACCHDPKSHKHDIPAIAKAKRREAKHYGIKPRTSRPIPGSRNTPFKIKFNAPPERRS